MKQIGTTEKRVIIFMGGGHNIISQEEEDVILKASTAGGAKGCKLKSGDWVTFSSISRIVGETKFYNENPKLRPTKTADQFEENYGEYTGSQLRQPTTRARELMQQGFVHQQMTANGVTKEEATKKFNDYFKSIKHK